MGSWTLRASVLQHDMKKPSVAVFGELSGSLEILVGVHMCDVTFRGPYAQILP